jgi:hypothetical protein
MVGPRNWLLTLFSMIGKQYEGGLVAGNLIASRFVDFLDFRTFLLDKYPLASSALPPCSSLYIIPNFVRILPELNCW